jgi:tRNA U54 and U55 pseudouridine synthase Pus10
MAAAKLPRPNQNTKNVGVNISKTISKMPKIIQNATGEIIKSPLRSHVGKATKTNTQCYNLL